MTAASRYGCHARAPRRATAKTRQASRANTLACAHPQTSARVTAGPSRANRKLSTLVASPGDVASATAVPSSTAAAPPSAVATQRSRERSGTP